jgi:predicted peptidase
LKQAGVMSSLADSFRSTSFLFYMKKNNCGRLSAVLILVCAFALTSWSQVQTARISTIVNGNCKGFYEYLPGGYSTPGNQKTYPLLLFIHGLGELGDGSSTKLPLILRNGPPKLINQKAWPDSFNVNGKQQRLIVLSPQFIKWPSNADIDTLIDYAVKNYRVDRSRIYMTGLSMGGGVVWNYVGTNNPNARRIAAIVPICGASSANVQRANVMANNDLPVWATHNDGDPTAPVAYTNGYIDYINGSVNPPTPLARKTIFVSNSHDAWSATYTPNFRELGKNVYEWMLQYSRSYTNTWKGTTSTVWEATSNWTEAVLPDANTNVVINSGNIIIKSNVTMTQPIY